VGFFEDVGDGVQGATLKFIAEVKIGGQTALDDAGRAGPSTWPASRAEGSISKMRL